MLSGPTSITGVRNAYWSSSLDVRPSMVIVTVSMYSNPASTQAMSSASVVAWKGSSSSDEHSQKAGTTTRNIPGGTEQSTLGTPPSEVTSGRNQIRGLRSLISQSTTCTGSSRIQCM